MDSTGNVQRERTTRGQHQSNLRQQHELSLHSKRFQITSGVRQECVLSPLLFIVYMDKITKEANPEPETVNEMLFADDQSLAKEDEKKLQKHTNSLNTTCDEYDVKISISQTETMKMSRTHSKLNVNGTQLQQVIEFKYLGSIFTEVDDLTENSKQESRKQTMSATSLHRS